MPVKKIGGNPLAFEQTLKRKPSAPPQPGRDWHLHGVPFDSAHELASKGNALFPDREPYGVGINFAKAEGIFCVDFDDVLDDDGELKPEHREMVEPWLRNTYTEISLRGHGLHIFYTMSAEIEAQARESGQLRFKLYPDHKHELFLGSGFIGITGRRWHNAPLTLARGTTLLAPMLEQRRRTLQHVLDGQADDAQGAYDSAIDRIRFLQHLAAIPVESTTNEEFLIVCSVAATMVRNASPESRTAAAHQALADLHDYWSRDTRTDSDGSPKYQHREVQARFTSLLKAKPGQRTAGMGKLHLLVRERYGAQAEALEHRMREQIRKSRVQEKTRSSDDELQAQADFDEQHAAQVAAALATVERAPLADPNLPKRGTLADRQQERSQRLLKLYADLERIPETLKDRVRAKQRRAAIDDRIDPERVAWDHERQRGLHALSDEHIENQVQMYVGLPYSAFEGLTLCAGMGGTGKSTVIGAMNALYSHADEALIRSMDPVGYDAYWERVRALESEWGVPEHERLKPTQYSGHYLVVTNEMTPAQMAQLHRANGGRPGTMHILSGAWMPDGKADNVARRPFSLLRDADVLLRYLESCEHLPDRIVFDTLSSFAEDIDLNRGEEVESFLLAWNRFFQRMHIQARGIMHFNKKVDLHDTVLGISGSVKLATVVRAVDLIYPYTHRVLDPTTGRLTDPVQEGGGRAWSVLPEDVSYVAVYPAKRNHGDPRTLIARVSNHPSYDARTVTWVRAEHKSITDATLAALRAEDVERARAQKQGDEDRPAGKSKQDIVLEAIEQMHNGMQVFPSQGALVEAIVEQTGVSTSFLHTLRRDRKIEIARDSEGRWYAKVLGKEDRVH